MFSHVLLAVEKRVYLANIQLFYFGWTPLNAGSLDIFSRLCYIILKPLYAYVLRGGPALPALVRFRWNDRAKEGGVGILYVYWFR